MMRVTETAKTIRKIVISTAAVCVMTLPVIASASIVGSEAVSHDGLDLNSAEGQARLYDRLKNETRNVCGSTHARGAGSVERAIDNQKCYDETLNVAVQRVGNPGLTELHQK